MITQHHNLTSASKEGQNPGAGHSWSSDSDLTGGGHIWAEIGGWVAVRRRREKKRKVQAEETATAAAPSEQRALELSRI